MVKVKGDVNTRLRLSCIALIALFLLLAITVYLSAKVVQRDSALIADDAIPGSTQAHAMRTALSNGFRAYALAALAENNVAAAEQLELARGFDEAFATAFAKYSKTLRINPAQDEILISRLSIRHEELTRRREAFVMLMRAGDRARNIGFLERELIPAYLPVSDAADALVDSNHVNAVMLADDISRHTRNLRLSDLIVLTLAVISGAILTHNFLLQNRQQRALRASERRFRELLENIFAFVGVLEPGGIVREVNRAPLEKIGIRREEVIGKLFQEAPWCLHSPVAKKKIEEAMREAVAGRTHRSDLDLTLPDHRPIIVDFGCGPMLDASGRVAQLVVTAVDISERKRLEEQFLRAQRMEAIGALASGLAHDLNNILSPILMAAEILKPKLTSTQDLKIISMVETGAQRGAAIIRQLLTFSRGTDSVRGRVQVNYLLRDMAHIIEETFPRNIELERQTPRDLWPVVADATQLHQVLLNLCVNARDAMPQGGKLSLRAENLDVSGAMARANQVTPGRYLMITVADTGEGIPREIINRIFDPFFTTKPVGKGTGLGLSTTLGIVKSHDGFLTVDSEPGKGAVFQIYLPVETQGSASAMPFPPQHAPRGHGEMILLVDDEDAMREAARVVLEMNDYRVLVADGGEQALRLFQEQRAAIKIVLTDVNMPGMGGLKLTRELREVDPEVKVIVMTGTAGDDTISGFAPLGVMDILEKPCEPIHLLKRLHAALHPAANASAAGAGAR